MKATTKTDKKDKITHIKMWIGPKILPSRLVVQKDKKSIPCKDIYGIDNVTQQSYREDEKMQYEIDETNITNEEKQILGQIKQQYKTDNKTDVNFVLVDYQKTLKEECKKFADLGENVIFVYDSSWFNDEEKQKMQAFLTELPDNCYAVDGKILLEQFRKDQCIITPTTSERSFDSQFSNGGKKWHLMLAELERATENIKINDDNNGTIRMADRVCEVCGKLENEQDIQLSDIISVFDKIVNSYKENQKNNNVTNNEIVPLYSIGNIVDFYRMIVLLKPKQIIKQANMEKKKNQDNLALSNTFLYHDFDVVLPSKNVSIDVDILSQFDSKVQKDSGIILSKRGQQECNMCNGPDKIENGLMLVKYNDYNENKAIETLLANYIKFIQVCNTYFANENNKSTEEMINYFNKCSIFEFLCEFNRLCYDYGYGGIYDVNFTYKVFKNFIDEQHRSWFCYSKDLSKDDKMSKGEEKKESHKDETLIAKTGQRVNNGNEVVNAGSNIEQFKTNVKNYITSGNNGDNNIVENIKQLAQNDNGKEFLRNCHCNIAFFAKAKREHQVFLTYDKILNSNPDDVKELVSINDVKSWNMCGCSCG